MAVDLSLLENSDTTHAVDLRRFWRSVYLGAGVVDGGDLDVSQRGAGANMSVDVARGVCTIADGNTLPGLYPFINDAVANVAIATADATNPRIDIVVAKILDTAQGDGSDAKSVAVITGTPGASPAVPSTPTRCLKLAEVNVAAGASSITNANIVERRVWAPGAKSSRGLLGSVTTTNTGPFTSTTALNGSLMTLTTEQSRRYKYQGCGRLHGSVDGQVATIILQKDGGALIQQDVHLEVAGRSYEYNLFWIDSPTAGSHTYRAVGAIGIGGGNMTAESGGPFILEDVGGATIV